MIIDLKRLQKKQANRHSGRKAAVAPVAEAPVAEAPVVAPEPEAEPEAEELTMANTKAELTAGAEAAGITVDPGWTKAQILAAMYPGE